MRNDRRRERERERGHIPPTDRWPNNFGQNSSVSPWFREVGPNCVVVRWCTCPLVHVPHAGLVTIGNRPDVVDEAARRMQCPDGGQSRLSWRLTAPQGEFSKLSTDFAEAPVQAVAPLFSGHIGIIAGGSSAVVLVCDK